VRSAVTRSVRWFGAFGGHPDGTGGAVSDEFGQLVLEEARDKMAKAVEHARTDFATVRTGRATPALVETLMVDYYGTPTPMRQLAGFSVADAMLLVVSPYDKGSLAAIEKAILVSDLGINPSNDGNVIRLAFPPLTEERRKELVKVVRHKAEEARVAVRNVRRGARHELDGLEKDGSVTADEVERYEKELEKVTHGQVATIDELLSHKERELLEV
jgi:ribosome recycling factor